jgi:hypothetical protein
MVVQVEGGKWALTSDIPSRGAAYGAIRLANARWPHRLLRTGANKPFTAETFAYELCYSIAPLDEKWGDLSRLMVLSSRFLLRNDSRLSICAKQAGTPDQCAVTIEPGRNTPFHWSDFRLPGLICIRPLSEGMTSLHRWSGGFDPLTIGSFPLKVRALGSVCGCFSLKVEVELRSKTGGTGINISFQDEDTKGYGALFRIENISAFPIWFAQDGLVASSFTSEVGASDLVGDSLQPNESSVFALDVPFRQGKYAGRKAAAMADLTRVRLALAPLNSRHGIETTKVISMVTVGERVRLNPSKLTLLSSELRSSIRRVRVVGTLLNDGPTRMLRLG